MGRMGARQTLFPLFPLDLSGFVFLPHSFVVPAFLSHPSHCPMLASRRSFREPLQLVASMRAISERTHRRRRSFAVFVLNLGKS